MLEVLRFWLIIQLFAVIALPLAWRLFAALPSRGYLLAKPLGLLLVSYFLWLGSSLGLLRNSTGGILAALLLVAALSLWLGAPALRRSGSSGKIVLLTWLRARRRWIVAAELLFLAALLAAAAMRSYSPQITTAGGEKWMELTFLNGILRSQRFPPLDPWLSGFGISYYYFGYVILAVLTRLSGLPAGVAFNVGLAVWFALTVGAAFGIAYDMAAALLRARPGQAVTHRSRLPLLGGLLGALFVAVMGNLAGFLESMQGIGLGSLRFWRWLDIKDLSCMGGEAFTEPLVNCPQATGLLPQRFYWWWRASRVLTDRDLAGRAIEVIDEFPFFSFLLGDMHPHVLALPFVLLAVGLALAVLLRVMQARPARPGAWVEVLPLGWAGLALYALCFGALAFLNTWDLPIYLFLLMLALAATLAWPRGGLSWATAAQAFLLTGLIAVVGVLCYLPFYAGFQSQAGGVLPNFLWPTRLPQLAVMFGPLLLAAVLLPLAVGLNLRAAVGPRPPLGRAWLRYSLVALLLPLLFLAVVMGVGVLTSGGQALVSRLNELPIMQGTGTASVGQLALAVLRLRLATPWSYLLLALLLGATLALMAHFLRARIPAPAHLVSEPSAAPVTLFALLALLTALLLVFSVEFVYLRDTFGTRMNTVFKFYFQAWVLLGLVAAFTVVYLIEAAPRWLRRFGLPLLGLLTVAGLFYPVLAIYTRSEQFRPQPTLDGTAYLAQQSPGDSAAAAWLRANVSGPAVVLEANGGSYTYAGRISAQTGLATLLGWDGHELQWRGNTVEQDKRRPVVARIYEAATGAELQGLLNQWQIDYVVVGELERQTFHLTPQSEARLAQVMQAVYAQDGVVIYRNRQAGGRGW